MHFAARRNLAGICRWLLRLGANVNRTDILDRTALHDAVRHNAADVARLLLAQVIREEISTRHARKVKTVHLTQAGTTTDAG